MSEDYSEKTARRILSLIDLTDLRDECRREDVVALCERAQTTYGNTAAICIWPRFVADARSTLGRNSSVKIATVVNFPDGTASCMDVIEEASRAIEDGADEIDLVIPYRAFLDGDEDAVTEMVRAVRKVCGNPIRLKTILETGVLGQEALIRRATVLSLEAGADFIKTSTGKVKLNATIEAATLILLVLKDYGRNVGFKPAGGIKSIAAAAEYLQIADRVMGAGWARPETFRFGTSSLLEQITGALGGGTITSDISVDY